jgi:hypothetical protein
MSAITIQITPLTKRSENNQMIDIAGAVPGYPELVKNLTGQAENRLYYWVLFLTCCRNQREKLATALFLFTI